MKRITRRRSGAGKAILHVFRLSPVTFSPNTRRRTKNNSGENSLRGYVSEAENLFLFLSEDPSAEEDEIQHRKEKGQNHQGQSGADRSKRR